MRKLKTFLLTALMSVTLCLCFIFTSCSGKIEGTYKFKSMSYSQDGTSVNLEVGEEFMGMITLTEDFMMLTLNEDGTATMVSSMEESQTMTGTWEKKEDGKIAITFEGDTQVCDCDGKTLTIDEEGSTIVLTK